MTVAGLKGIIEDRLLAEDTTLEQSARQLVEELEAGIRRWGIVDHKIYGKIFAYEVDGRGSVYLSDDANVPSLLSLPYLGYLSADDEIYQRTRFFLLSPDNPWFFTGKHF